MAIAIGTKLGRYEIRSLIGVGGLLTILLVAFAGNVAADGAARLQAWREHVRLMES